MYAVIRTGGKQYRVEPGQRLKVEKIPNAVGDTVELTDVLLLATDEGATVGNPTVAKAKVVAEVASQGRDRKLSVFKYKSKTRYRRLMGHRQPHTVLLIKELSGPGIAAPKTRRRRAKRSVDAPVGDAVEEKAAKEESAKRTSAGATKRSRAAKKATKTSATTKAATRKGRVKDAETGRED